MDFWLRLAHRIDRLSDLLGRLVGWLTLAMVLVGAYNVVVRYLGRYIGWHLASNAYIELQWYLFSVVFLLGAAYALRRDAHVRVDVVYSRLGPRGRAWVDLVGTCLLLMPFAALCLWLSWPAVRSSWEVGERSPDPGGLVRYPLKALILVAFALLMVQGVAELIRRLAVLTGRQAEAAHLREWTT